jgi:hypothetical protein
MTFGDQRGFPRLGEVSDRALPWDVLGDLGEIERNSRRAVVLRRVRRMNREAVSS